MLAAAASSNAASISLDGLLEQLALDSDEITLAYRQVQSSKLLREPTITSGEITIRRNGTIQQRWQGEDGVYRLAIDGDRAHLTNPDGERRFGLTRRPGLAAMVASLRAITRGDAAALRERFQVSLGGDASEWRLELTARGATTPSTAGQPGHQEREKPPRLTFKGAEAIERIHLRGDGRETEIIMEDTP